MREPSTYSWLSQMPTATDEAIERAERAIGIRFPSDFRKFIATYQGAIPVHVDFSLEDSRVKMTGVGQFISFASSHPTNVLARYQELLGRIGPRLVPIAFSGNGDVTCFDFSAEPPRIVYWHHEREGLPDAVTSVAESFSAFTDKWTVADIEAEEALYD